MVQPSVVIVALGVGGCRMMSSSAVWATSECPKTNEQSSRNKKS